MNEWNKWKKLQAVAWVIGITCLVWTLFNSDLAWKSYFFFASGYIFSEVARAVADRAANPYRWKCPHEGCRFEFKANREDAFDTVVMGHQKDHFYAEHGDQT